MNLHRKIHFAISSLLLLILHSLTANADIYEMKDGTSINATLIKKTADSYILRAEVTNNVFVEKTVLISEVSKITKIDLSIAAYKKIASILPTNDLLDVKTYEHLIKSKVEPFLEKYPSSPHYKDAESILNTLNKEYNVVKYGGVKINGQLHAPHQVKANKYDIQAYTLKHNFMMFVRKKKYRAALSTLERLENNYPDSVQCRDAQKVALTILPLYKKILHKVHDNVGTLIEKRKQALSRMTDQDNTRTKKIFAYEETQYQNLLSLATTNGKKNKWLPINKYFKAPIINNIKMIDSEMTRLRAESQSPTVDAGKYYRLTYAALENGDYPSIKENFEKFKRCKPSQKILNELEPRLIDAKIVMEKEKILRKEEEALAKKIAAEERARLAKERSNAAKNKPKGDSADYKKKVRDKLNINKKQQTIDKLSQ